MSPVHWLSADFVEAEHTPPNLPASGILEFRSISQIYWRLRPLRTTVFCSQRSRALLSIAHLVGLKSPILSPPFPFSLPPTIPVKLPQTLASKSPLAALWVEITPALQTSQSPNSGLASPTLQCFAFRLPIRPKPASADDLGGWCVAYTRSTNSSLSQGVSWQKSQMLPMPAGFEPTRAKPKSSRNMF